MMAREEGGGGGLVLPRRPFDPDILNLQPRIMGRIIRCISDAFQGVEIYRALLDKLSRTLPYNIQPMTSPQSSWKLNDVDYAHRVGHQV